MRLSLEVSLRKIGGAKKTGIGALKTYRVIVKCLRVNLVTLPISLYISMKYKEFFALIINFAIVA
jgi:hypothetical protein